MTESSAPDCPPAPLAIVGLSCLFPQAGSVSEFWSNIRRGVDTITEVPASHWRPEDYFDADPKSPDMTYAQRGGFLSPIPFDPLEFGIAPSNLEAIDTSQLLGLVASKRALEDAGYGTSGKPCDRSRIGCILGVTGTLEMVIPLGARLGHPKWRQALKDAGVSDDVAADVMQRISEAYVPWQENSFPGLLGNVVAGRIANRLDLGGTNCVVDAACASSLSALHLAALELWTGRADMVLTGGVDTFNDIFMYMCFSKTPALSATGAARPFAEDADGTILGEGVGVLALKRLADAERDGDRIYAVLRGIGTSSDGAGNAVYAPKKEGQIRCLEEAYRIAGVSPATIELVEAHGTGTKVGDATEVAALNEVYRRSGRQGTWCALGSVKSQIGHTKAAAGAAGVFKAILALQHRVLPPTIKVGRPPELLLTDDAPLYVNTQARPWIANADFPRRAAVSAFGFGGSNFHCVLEEAPQAQSQPDWDDDVILAAFSADSVAALRRQLEPWQQTLDWATARARAVATRAAFQPSHAQRLICVWERGKSQIASSIAAALQMFDSYPERTQWSTPDGIVYGQGPRDGKLAVLFPGQGSQAVGMLRELALRFPVMQDVLAEADAAFADCVESSGRQARLSDRIYPRPAWTEAAREAQEAQLRATEVAQPAIGAVSLGALAVLSQFGIAAELTAGHSYGELTALCASRRYQPRSLYRLSTLRGQLMAAAQEVDGGMLAVGGSLSQVEAAIQEAAVDLVIANRNGPNQVVLSGRLPDIERAAELFSRHNLRGKRLPVAAAFHSPLVAAASEKFRPLLDDVEFAPGDVPVFANSNAAPYPADAAAARDLLANQLSRPVEFVQQIENMYAAGARCFVEVGPGGVLTGLVHSILSGREYRAVAVDASQGKRTGLADLAFVLAQLAAAGYRVDLTAWDPQPPPEVVPSDRLTIPLCGANYVKPRTPRPPRPRSEPTPAPKPAAAVSAPPSQPPIAVPTPPAAARKLPPAPPAPFTVPSAQTIRTAPAAMPNASESLPSQLVLLQKMQEDTARLHRQFLEGQEAALRTLASLATGSSVTPAASASVATHSAPAPLAPAVRPAAVALSRTPGPAPAPLPTGAVRPAPLPMAVARPIPTPSPVPMASTVAVPKSSAAPSDLAAQVLKVVAEKTGYPVEMLKPVMSLDHDLGIDSIKRVEILAAVQERLPQMPSVTPEQLQTLHRLQDVLDLLGAAPSPAVNGQISPAVAAIVSTVPPTTDLTPQVLKVVAEKTGYPVEMLKPAMSLDHDLGIDSIKRVEILSALQEQLPQLPTVSPEQLQTLHRLQDVIDLLPSGGTPAADVGVTLTVPASTTDLTPQVLQVVAEKTGYPVEMLKPAMSLDHDLGIDSIKRVEILSALQEQLPQLPTVSPEQLQTLHRLQDVIDLLPQALPATATPSGTATASPVTVDLSPQVLRVVAEKTGYPVEMLKPAMSLDHDLGIDSIKRVEILSALQEQLPQLPAVTPEQLQTLHRLQDVIDLLGGTGSAAVAPIRESVVAPQPEVRSTVTEPGVEVLQCGAVVAVPCLPESPRTPLAFPAGGEFWVTDDGSELAPQLAERFTRAGYRGRVVAWEAPKSPAAESPFAGLVLLAPQAGMTDAHLWRALEWTQHVGPTLRTTAEQGHAALFASVSRLDGQHGTGTQGTGGDVVSGGLAGLTKTVRHEWPTLVCKGLDLASDATSRTAAEALGTELLHQGPVECGLTSTERYELQVSAVDPRSTDHQVDAPLRANDLVLVTGGARGVTAAAAIALARAYRPTLVLLGRSPIPSPEPDYLAGVTEPTHIKQALATHGAASTPRALQQQCQQVLANREIAATLAALRALGVTAEYQSADVRQADDVRTVIETLERQYGPVRGVLHGAGVLADHRIEDKTREQFESVYGTKVTGLRNVLSALGSASQLRALLLFSSFTARYGRTGQVDYAMANEVLNKWGQQFRRRHPDCKVLSFNWGPWDGGMVQGGLKDLFAKEGVGLIPLSAGAELVATGLRSPTASAVELVVLGPGSQMTLATASPTRTSSAAAHTDGDASPASHDPIPADARVAVERTLSMQTAPYLQSHVIGGKGVLPVALIVEWLAHGVLHQNPGLEFQGCDQLQVFKGIRLDVDDAVTVQVLVGKPVRQNGQFVVAAHLATTTGETRQLHARADILLGSKLPTAPAAQPDVTGSDIRTIERPYDLLFHGPAFLGIDRVTRCSETGLVLESRTAEQPVEWSPEPLRTSWIADPLAIDVALQGLIVWSRTFCDRPCLPSAIGTYRQYRKAFPADGVQVAIRITQQTAHVVQAAVEFRDRDGTVIATMTHVDNVLNAALADAFQQNELALIS